MAESPRFERGRPCGLGALAVRWITVLPRLRISPTRVPSRSAFSFQRTRTWGDRPESNRLRAASQAAASPIGFGHRTGPEARTLHVWLWRPDCAPARPIECREGPALLPSPLDVEETPTAQPGRSRVRLPPLLTPIPTNVAKSAAVGAYDIADHSRREQPSC